MRKGGRGVKNMYVQKGHGEETADFGTLSEEGFKLNSFLPVLVPLSGTVPHSYTLKHAVAHLCMAKDIGRLEALTLNFDFWQVWKSVGKDGSVGGYVRCSLHSNPHLLFHTAGRVPRQRHRSGCVQGPAGVTASRVGCCARRLQV